MLKLIKTADFFKKYKLELMGISIVWIMLFHSSIQAPDNMFLRAIWYLFVSFGGGIGVDAFLILSGFGITYSCLKREVSGRKESWRSYYKRRFMRIIPAYFIVASMYYILSCCTVHEFFYKISFLNFIMDGERDFWYILAIIVCYLAFPIFGELRRKFGYRIPLLVLAVSGELITLIIMTYFQDVYNNWEIALWRFPCFWIGCYYGCLMYEKRAKEFYIVSGTFLLLGSVLLVHNGLTRNVFTLFTPFIMIMQCILLEMIQTENNNVGKILRYLGQVSLELYLVHVSFGIYIADYVYSKTGVEAIRLLVYSCSSVLIAAWIHCLVAWTGKKISEKG